jgi:hypothetical protein
VLASGRLVLLVLEAQRPVTTTRAVGAGIFPFPTDWNVPRRRREAAEPGDIARLPRTRTKTSRHVSPALVGLPSPRVAARRERGRAAERAGGGEEQTAVVVGALVGVGERGVGRVHADEVLGGGVRGRDVRVHVACQAAVRRLDLPRAGARAEAEDVVEGGAAGHVVCHGHGGGGGGGGEGRGERRRWRVEARRGRRRRGRRGRGARAEGEEAAGGERWPWGDHVRCREGLAGSSVRGV